MTLLPCLVLLAVAASAEVVNTDVLAHRGVACYVGHEFFFPGLDDNSSVVSHFKLDWATITPQYCPFDFTACTTVIYTDLTPLMPSKNTFLLKECRRARVVFKDDFPIGVRKTVKYEKFENDPRVPTKLLNISIESDCCHGDLCNSKGTLNGSNKEHAAGTAVILIALLALLLISPSRD